MKRRDLKELRTKEGKELNDLLAKKQGELGEARIKVRTGDVKNVKTGKNIRHDIAQLKTLLREKELGGEV